MFFSLFTCISVLLQCLTLLVDANPRGCSRTDTRIVRQLFAEKSSELYQQFNLMLPPDCPFNINRNLFSIQDLYTVTTENRWTCQLCGKSFYDSYFLDRHFDLRHPIDDSQSRDLICLADYCDWMRCDVVGHRLHVHFWDIALCQQTTMRDLMDKCLAIISSCIPSGINSSVHHLVSESLNNSLCKHLTCDAYFTDGIHSDQGAALFISLKILITVSLLFGLGMYYYIAVAYFYYNQTVIKMTR